MKICRTCKQPKEEFPKNGLYWRSDCSECYSKICMTRYYENHDERKRQAAIKRERPDVKQWHRAYRLRTRFGITIEQYDALLNNQNGCCAICKEKIEESLHVDHCHTTNRVRGLLCRPCNTALGLFHENTDRMRAAIRYLETV